jgi:hypothetical protein
VTGEQYGLLTHIVTKESVSVWHAEEKLTAFLEIERITHELVLLALLGDDPN